MKTNKIKLAKVLRWTARILSALFIAFFLILFIGESMEPLKNGTFFKPISMYDKIHLSLMGLIMIGLGIAWKWELAGGIISVTAFIIITSIHRSLIYSPMTFYLLNGLLFLLVWWIDRKNSGRTDAE
jgi:hypothetical protein